MLNFIAILPFGKWIITSTKEVMIWYGWLVGLMVGWLVGWSNVWLVGVMVGWFV